MLGNIYIVKNDINDQVYVGQTIHNIEYRFNQHCKEAERESYTKFHVALRELGIQHFHVELLEQCEQEELNNREKYYISFYDSYKNGYNSTTGGTAINKQRKKTDKEIIDFYLEHKDKMTLTEISYSLETGFNYIRDLLEKENIREKKPYKRIQDLSIQEKKDIYNYIVKEKHTYTDAIKYFRKDMRTIKKILQEFNFDFSTYNNSSSNKKTPILQLDLEDNIIAEWDSIYAAEKFYKNKHIRDCINGTRKKASGYKWKIRG